jgi:phenylacetate-CoA ligase
MIPVAAYAQVLDDNGDEALDGNEGEVVVTDLYGSVGPLVRYRLHDRAIYREDVCECGRELHSIELSRGRIDSFIRTPAHGAVYDAILAYSVPPSVSRFRVTQTDLTHLSGLITVRPGADPISAAQECKRRWEHALGPGMSVSVTPVDAIPPEYSGKLQYFVPLQG